MRFSRCHRAGTTTRGWWKIFEKSSENGCFNQEPAIASGSTSHHLVVFVLEDMATPEVVSGVSVERMMMGWIIARCPLKPVQGLEWAAVG